MKDKNRNLIPTDNYTNITPSYARSTTLQDMLNEAEILIKSSVVPFTKPEDVVIVLQAAQDLKMSISFAIANLYVINGRLTTGVHILEGLLLRGGVIIETVEDAVPVSHFMSRGKIQLCYSAEELLDKLNSGKYEVTSAEHIKAKTNDANKIPLLPINPPYITDGTGDKRTTINMVRQLKTADGKFRTIEQKTSYYLHEAFQAGYMDKDNWNAHTNSMMYSRCFGRGSKRIASDLTFGMMELSEAADAFDVDYVVVEEDGNAIPTLTPHTEE